MNNFEVNELLDFYENLLTKRQVTVMNYYYKEDLSLSEIGEILEISKSAVADLIKRVEINLLRYEEKLQLIKKHKQRLLLFKEINDQELVNKFLEIEEGE